MSISSHARASSPRRALVFPVNHPRAVATIRSLGRAGIEVVALDPRTNSTGMHSRHLARKVQVAADPDTLLGFLETSPLARDAMLFPTSDDALALVARHADRLEKHSVVAAPSWEVLGALYDRARCHALVREAGLRHPAFHQPASLAALDALLPDLELGERHYVIKTDVIDEPADLRTRRHTRVVGPDADGLRERWREVASRSASPPLLQEVVPGESDACIGVTLVADRDHAPVLAHAVRRLKLQTYSRGGFQHPYELGANVFCETVRDDEAVEAAMRFARHVGYVGCLTVEFRRDPRDGRLVFIKADPRPVRSTSLSSRIGLDVPLATWRVFAGLPPLAPPAAVPEGVGWLWPRAVGEILRNGGRGDRRQLRALLGRVWRVRSFAYLDATDPLPALRDATTLLPHGAARWARRRLRRLHQRRVRVERAAQAEPTHPFSGEATPG